MYKSQRGSLKTKKIRSQLTPNSKELQKLLMKQNNDSYRRMSKILQIIVIVKGI